MFKAALILFIAAVVDGIFFPQTFGIYRDIRIYIFWVLLLSATLVSIAGIIFKRKKCGWFLAVCIFFAYFSVAVERVRDISYRMVCGSNLSTLGKSMITYMNDNKEKLPDVNL